MRPNPRHWLEQLHRSGQGWTGTSWKGSVTGTTQAGSPEQNAESRSFWLSSCCWVKEPFFPSERSWGQEAQELVATQAGQGTGSPRTRPSSDPEAWGFAAQEAAPGTQAWILSLAQHQQSNREALLATGKEVNTANGPEQKTTKVEGSPQGACMDGLYCGPGASPRQCLKGAGSSHKAR